MTMITPSYLGETIEYSSLHACRSTLEDPTVTGNTNVRIWKLTDPLGTATLSSQDFTVPDNGGQPSNGAPQCPGGAPGVPTLTGFTQGNACLFRGTLWFCITAGPSAGPSRCYYYAVDIFHGVVTHTGAIAASDGVTWYYQPSIGVALNGSVGMVFVRSSPTLCPTISCVTRTLDDSSFSAVQDIFTSPSPLGGDSSGNTRFGDNASATADPFDNSFWVTHEYARSTNLFDWGTRIANIAPSA